MSEETTTTPASAAPAADTQSGSGATPPARTQQFRIGAVVVLALVIGIVLWLVLRDSGGSSNTAKEDVSSTSAGQITSLANQLGHPIYWVGPQKARTYELRRQPNGSIVVRYLPNGVDVGSSDPYLSVATYPFPGAYPAIQKLTRQKGITSFKIPGGGLAEYSNKDPESVHLAYPGVDYQVEIFDPGRGRAIALAKSGKVAGAGNASRTSGKPSTAAKPVIASLATLKALPKSVGHPVYWVGQRSGSTYELMRSSDGKVILRYLPAGVKAGSPKPYLSVGTYPFPKAFAATKALTKDKGTESIDLPDGGIAVISKSYPSSIHLAYPDSDYQVEVYDPTPSVVRNLVASGAVTPIG